MRWFIGVAELAPDPLGPRPFGDEPTYQVWNIRAADPESAMNVLESRTIRYATQGEPIDLYLYPLDVEPSRAKTVKAYRPDWRVPQVGFAHHGELASAKT